MKKGKLLAGILAALLLMSIVPASAFAGVVLETPLGPYTTLIPKVTIGTQKLPIAFTFDNEFVWWFGEIFRENFNSIGTILAPIKDGDKLVLIFGGEQPDVLPFTDAQQRAIRDYFAKGIISSVDIYLTNLSPMDPKAYKVPYPVLPMGLASLNKVDDTLSFQYDYIYLSNAFPPNVSWNFPDTDYERITNFIGLIADSTQVNVIMSDELDWYVTKTTDTYKSVYFAIDHSDDDEIWFVNYNNPKFAYFTAKDLIPGRWNADGRWEARYFVSADNYLLDSGGRYIYVQMSQWFIDQNIPLPFAFTTASTLPNNRFRISLDMIEKGLWIEPDLGEVWVHLDSGDCIKIGILTYPDVTLHWIKEVDGGDRILRSDVTYHLANGYYNDMALVDITIGKDTLLSFSASAYVQEVTVQDGGRLNLSRVNYSVLNSLFTKWIGKLNLAPGSKVDFPVGTTSEIAMKWLGNTVITGVNFFINGKATTFSSTPIIDDLPKAVLGGNHVSPTAIKISWNAVAGAESYNLLMATSQSGTYNAIASSITATEFIAAGLSTGTTYYFKVEAVAGEKKSMSDVLAVRARPLRPASANAAPGPKNGQITLNWGAVAECDGYAIYVSQSLTGTYSLKQVVSGKNTLSTTLSGFRSGETCYFKVVSFVQVGPAKVPSVYTGAIYSTAK